MTAPKYERNEIVLLEVKIHEVHTDRDGKHFYDIATRNPIGLLRIEAYQPERTLHPHIPDELIRLAHLVVESGEHAIDIDLPELAQDILNRLHKESIRRAHPCPR